MKNFSLIFLLFAFLKGYTFPIPQQTLKSLIEKSPYIIEGYVYKIIQKNNTNNESYSVAKIRISSKLKGKISNDTISISFYPNMICPSPDFYEINEKVICFVDKKSNSDNDFFVPGLSYGKKTIQNEIELKLYQSLIKSYLKIVKNRDENKKTIQTTEWLVKCVENSITRNDAVSDLLKSYDYEKNISVIKYQKFLSNKQRKRIYNCFLSINNDVNYNHYDIGLLNFTKGINDKKILTILKERANKVSEPDVVKCNLFIYYIGMYLNKDFSETSRDLSKNLGTMKYNRKEDKDRMKVVYENFLALINSEIK
jgi:hypothetical protein